MQHPILQRVELLISQGRIVDADQQIRAFLQDDPTSEYGRYLLAYILYFQGKSKESERLTIQLQQDDPENPAYLALLAEINMREDELDAAEEKGKMLLQMSPYEVQFHNLMSRIKFAQRYFDSSLKYANSALEIDPENLEALNQKTLIAGMLGDRQSAKNTILEALEKNPEDPYTIANHAHQLLKEGNVKGALDRFGESLSLNPNNSLARYGMQEALKSKFFLYKLFYKYFDLMGRLTANGSWGFVIGTYVLYRLLNHVSRTNEALSPIVTPLMYLLLAFFILSWIINPLMNLYLMTNKYGRLLLDDDDKKMAQYTGASLLIAFVGFGLYLTLGGETNLMAGIFFVGMMIPLGSFLAPYDIGQKKKLTMFTIGIFILGVLGLVLHNDALLTGAFIALFGYQIYMNSVSISSSARKKE
jgi:tetratricopeptide (TPR) repeat protein